MPENVLQMTGTGKHALTMALNRTAHTAIGEEAMHQLKTAVHHELIKRMDLDKLAAMQNDPGGRGKLLATISGLVGEQPVPLSSDRSRKHCEGSARRGLWPGSAGASAA